MADVMGFKREFHCASIHFGVRLMRKIEELNPQYIATDGLSYRLQFNQLLPYNVLHPIEILSQSYSGYFFCGTLAHENHPLLKADPVYKYHFVAFFS